MDTDAELATMKPRSRVPVVVAAVLGIVLGAALGAGGVLAFGRGPAKKQATEGAQARTEASASASAPTASASVSPPASAAASASPAAGSALLRLSSGDPEAIKALEAKQPQERSLEEALSLAKAREGAKLREIAELKRKLTLVPKFAEEKATQSRIRELASDREVATEMLGMLASLPEPLGPDQLFAILVRNATKEESQKLAGELLLTKEVRTRASPALNVAVDLRNVTECEQAKKVLEHAKQHADKRAVGALMRLEQKRGCGKRELEDCWKCLRVGDLLKETIAEARKR
jgi:hypothetical protein